MANNKYLGLSDEKKFSKLLQDIAHLQSLAGEIGIEQQGKQSCIYQEERNKSIHDDKEESLKIIKQTSDIARLAMFIIVRGLQTCALHACNKTKYFNTLSSTISYIREQKDSYQAPKHLLLEWERNVILIDLFTNDEGLYCNKRIAQDMFDICMETFDWLRSLDNDNK